MKKLEEERTSLIHLISLLEKNAIDYPEGHLRLDAKKDRKQFYQVIPPNRPQYISKNDMGLIRALAQKDYEQKLLSMARSQCKCISDFLSHYDDRALQRVYEHMHVERQKLIHPYEISESEFIAQWQSEPYVGKGFLDSDPEHRTKRGERVRSKSEVLIANLLNDYDIPYKYECPKRIGGTDVYPDFTFLPPSTRQEMYWEHFGMMDRPGYVEDFLWKMNHYPKYGIMQGKNLIMTFESGGRPLNIQVCELILREFLNL